MTVSKPRLLMAVFGELQYDGRVLRAADALARDFEVTVLAASANKGYQHPRFRVIETTLWPRSFATKMLSLAWFWIRFFMAALVLRPGVVYANDYYLPLVGWVAARLAQARCVYDAHELIIPETGERRARKNHWLFYQMERLCIRHVDLVIAAGAERATLMREHYGLRATPTVIRNIPPAPAIPGPRSAAIRGNTPPQLPETDKPRLVYAGMMSLARGLGFFLEVMKTLANRCELVLVGFGPDYEKMQTLVDEAGLARSVHFLGKVPHEALHETLAQCDLGIIVYPENRLNNIYCASNKIYEYPQAGLPVVTTGQPPLRAALETYGIGEVCKPCPDTTPAEAAGVILRMADNITAYQKRLGHFLNDHAWHREATLLRQSVGVCLFPSPLPQVGHLKKYSAHPDTDGSRRINPPAKVSSGSSDRGSRS